MADWRDDQVSEFTKKRWEMVRDLEPKLLGKVGEMARARVLSAMAIVPRHEFVPRGSVERAYDDVSLPNDDEDVAGGRVLAPSVAGWVCGLILSGIHGLGGMVAEVGGGRGYLAALLVECGVAVVSVGLDEQLWAVAQGNLDRTNYDQRGVFRVNGDPLVELPAYAPTEGYNGVVVTSPMIGGGTGDELVTRLTGMVRTGGNLVYMRRVGEEVVIVLRQVGTYRQVEEKEAGRWEG